MESLSSSTSLTSTTFQFPKQSKPNHHPQLNPPFSHNHHHNHPSSTSSLSTLHQKDTFTPLNFHYTKKSILPPPPPPPRALVHRRAASGYAAALLDVSQSNGTVLKVERDVRRLLKVLRNDHVKEFMMDEVVEEFEKGNVVKELLEKGKFDKNFVGLVKLVVGKKVDLVNDVLEEFLKVFSQLSTNNNNKNKKLVMGNA